MSIFDPAASPLPPELTTIPKHGAGWKDKLTNWWAGATIASPTTMMVAPANQALQSIHRLCGDIDGLNDFYAREGEYARWWVRRVAQVPEDTPVLLDACGSRAIRFAARLCCYAKTGCMKEFWTLTTEDGGSLPPAALQGTERNQCDREMQPVTGVFYNALPVLEYPKGMRISSRVVAIANKTNSQLIDEIRAVILSQTSSGCIVLPHVTETGRILPIREVGTLVAEAREMGRDVYYIIDDIQGIGRADAGAVADPLTFSDAYVLGSSKALGGILIASAAVIRADLLDTALERICLIQGDEHAPAVSHFQLSPTLEDRLPHNLFKPGAIPLPEIVSMRQGLHGLYGRGSADTFAKRRLLQLQETARRRTELTDRLDSIDGVSVMESTDDRPLVPSIVCLQIKRDGLSPAAVKKALQAGEPIITPCALAGDYLRLDIPEYRSMPSPAVLAERLREILH